MIAQVVEESGINPKENFPLHSGCSKERVREENTDEVFLGDNSRKPVQN
jgi:hypothetical protein